MDEQASRQLHRPFLTTPGLGARSLPPRVKYPIVACGGVLVALLVFFALKYLGY